MNSSQIDPSSVKILIVDDVPANRNLLRQALEPEGYQILLAPNGEVALEITQRAVPALIILDVLMPGIDGFETCRRLKAHSSSADIPVIFITAKTEVESLTIGFEVGGVDYLTKPFEPNEVVARVRTHLQLYHLRQELLLKNEALLQSNERLKQEIARREEAEHAFQNADGQLSILSDREAQQWNIAGFVGQSQSIRAILQEIRQLHRAGNTNVLITGESGTGKELVARAIHFGGSRGERPFIPINCSAIPSELAESLFFGYVRGTFTGATTDRKGYFEIASGGTLFLDEIGDMPLLLQAKLLRVLEDGVVTAVGATEEKRVDVRVISATNADVHQNMRTGKFREDLYHRLSGFLVHVPPLRERRDDIPSLANHFLRLFATDMRIESPTFTPDALRKLARYHFPGNIRELRNTIERALIRSNGNPITPAHLHFIDTLLPQDAVESSQPRLSSPTPPTDSDPAEDLPLLRRDAEKERILAYVKKHGSIRNSECRVLLSVDRNRARYLLDKLHRAGLLKREGTNRWAQYVLS